MAENKADVNGGRATMFQFGVTVVIFALGLIGVAMLFDDTSVWWIHISQAFRVK